MLPHFGDLPVCIEDGSTFRENAVKKAVHYSQDFAGRVFADDSGLIVDALGGAPGIFSARYAGPNASDEENNQRLLEELHGAEASAGDLTSSPAEARVPPHRAAHYECVIALAESGRLVLTVEGRADGVIIDHPRGRGGFGYDPYFYYPPLDKTFAEISAEEKFAVSHRGAAFRRLLDELARHIT